MRKIRDVISLVYIYEEGDIYRPREGLNVWNVRCLSDLNGSALYRGGYRRAHRGDFICLSPLMRSPGWGVEEEGKVEVRGTQNAGGADNNKIILAQTILGSTWGASWHSKAMLLVNAWAVMCICRTHLIGSPRTMCLYRFISVASGNSTGQSGRYVG